MRLERLGGDGVTLTNQLSVYSHQGSLLSLVPNTIHCILPGSVRFLFTLQRLQKSQDFTSNPYGIIQSLDKTDWGGATR